MNHRRIQVAHWFRFVLVPRVCIMTFRVYANNIDVTQYVSRQSLRITEQLNNRANICEFATLNYKIDQSSIVYIYEWYELREAVTADDLLKVRDTFKRFDNFAVGDEVIIDPEGAWRQFVIIDSIDNDLKEVSIDTNITAAAWTFFWRLIFAGTVERNPDEQIGYSENFEYFLTVSDRTSALNRKNVVDVYEDMYAREILWRMIYRFCANNSTIVLDTLDAARTEAGVARVMNDDTSDLVEWTASQSTWITGAGTATRTKTITTQDITDATDIRLRYKITAANAAKITSMKVRVGNDSSNYLERDASFIETADEVCRNYEAYKIERATTVWTVNLATIDRVQIRIVWTASITGWWLLFDEITATSWWFTLQWSVRWSRIFTKVNWNYEKLTNILEDVSKKQSLFRRVDYEKNVKIFESNDTPAPFDITDTSENYWNLSVKADTSMLRNRQVVRGGEAAASVIYEQIYVADGQQTSFLLDYKPKDIAVRVDTWWWYVSKTIGVENLVDESTVNFVFNFSEKVVRNGNLATLSAGHKIKFQYYPYHAVRVIVSDPASILAMKALAGGDWIFDGPVINDTLITSFDDARKRARAEITTYANPVVSASFITEQWWLRAWQVIRIQDTSRTLDQDFLIQKVVRNSIDGAKSSYQVDCASTMFGLIEFFQLLLKNAWKTGEDDSELVDIVISADETITITFDAIFTQKTDTFDATEMMRKVFDFVSDTWTATTTSLIGDSKQRKATKSAGATWSVWFDTSNHNNWKSMFIDISASGAAEYMSVEMNSLLACKASTQYKAHARIENLDADWLTGGDWLQLAVKEIGVTSTVDYDHLYYTFNGSTGVVTSATTDYLNLTSTTNVIASVRFRLNADAADLTEAQPIFDLPYVRLHVRTTTNQVICRFDNGGAKTSFYALWNGDRTRHHACIAVYNNWTNRTSVLYVDGTVRDTDTHSVWPSTKYSDNILMWKYGLAAWYFNGDIAQLKVYKFTWTTFNSSDATRLYQWLEPIQGNITSYLKRNTDEWSWTTAIDRRWMKNGAHTWWITHASSWSAPFKKTYDVLWVLATNNIVNNRDTKQDFKKSSEVTFTTDADTLYFSVFAKVLESTGKVSISDIVIDEQATESVANPAVADFSQAA